ncbi:MAG: 3-hydroxyacyl-CoA dehydrogenase [Pseudomonadota bacterium]
MKHPDQPDYVVGVVGCGAMGQGIAQVSAQGGMRTLLYDARAGAAQAARDRIAGFIGRAVEKGRMSQEDADAAVARLEPVGDLQGLKPADTVVEAIFEDLEQKQQIFADLEGAVTPECILASNTSSIPIASIARACQQRARVAGLHFFNPVPLMKLVEVIRPIGCDDQVIANLMALGKRMTRVPVEVQDSPGFLVNMGGRAYTTEALRIVHEGVATPAQVDAIMRDCWGFRMGPFELMDLTGIDVNYPVSQIIWEGYGYDPRLKTSPNHRAMFDAGLFGRKTGQGWYRYDDKGQMIDPPSADFVTDAAPIKAVQTDSDAVVTLCDEIGIDIVDGAPRLETSEGRDCVHQSTYDGTTPKPIVMLDMMGNTSKRITMMTPPGFDRTVGEGVAEGVAAAIIASGRKVTWIKDSPGFVGQRMVAMVGNLGCYMAEVGLASPEDIDTAMQLGLNYPRGSIALLEDIGVKRAYFLMTALHDCILEERYRPTQWLARRSMLDLSLYTPN